MIPAVHEDGNHRGRTRYTLVDTADGSAWGGCGEVEGLFGEPDHGTYELRGWVPEAGDVRGWLGRQVWLVPEDEELDEWRLADARSPGPAPGTADGLLLTGLDDYCGPPEAYTGPVRVHDEYRWLGSCRELARVRPAVRPASPWVLRGFAPGDRLREALAKAAGRPLTLEQASLELRDDRGERLTDRLLWAVVNDWRPSALGPDLIDLELDGGYLEPEPDQVRHVRERWFAGPPDTPGAWAGLDTRHRGAWHDLVRERACRRDAHDRPAGHAYELDGRHVTDEPGLWLALGEAVNGPGGYFGGDLTALHDCLGGTFGYTRPGTLLWHDSATARAHLSGVIWPNGERGDLFGAVLATLAESGLHVTQA
ncbi:barstar family protein [Kitasatospora sp. NPDC004240]